MDEEFARARDGVDEINAGRIRKMLKTIWPLANWLKIVKLALALTCFAILVAPFAARGQQAGKQSGDKTPPAPVQPPPVKKPVDYNRFTHQSHLGRIKVPNTNFARDLKCESCHKPTQKTLAVTIGSHPECYVCHTPGSFDEKAKVKSNCVICHTQRLVDIQAEPFDAKLASRAYGAKFSHVEHVKYMDCRACHSIEGGYNQYSPSSPRVKQHNTSAQTGGRGCFSCHDGKQHYGRAVFSGDDAQSCAKCHNLKGDIKVFKVRG